MIVGILALGLSFPKGVDCETDKCENTYTSLSLERASFLRRLAARMSRSFPDLLRREEARKYRISYGRISNIWRAFGFDCYFSLKSSLS